MMGFDEKEVSEAFKAHLRGEWPSEAEIATAPTLSKWSVDAFENYLGEFLMILTGNVEDHPVLGNCEIKTSPLLWIDKDRRVARTMSRVYALGNPAADLVHA